jgi:hypothetical protein
VPIEERGWYYVGLRTYRLSSKDGRGVEEGSTSHGLALSYLIPREMHPSFAPLLNHLFGRNCALAAGGKWLNRKFSTKSGRTILQRGGSFSTQKTAGQIYEIIHILTQCALLAPHAVCGGFKRALCPMTRNLIILDDYGRQRASAKTSSCSPLEVITNPRSGSVEKYFAH